MRDLRGLVGWPGGSWMGGGLRGSLGSGATRTWPPPWPLLGLPPPAGQNRVRAESPTPHPLIETLRLGGPRLIGLGLAVLRVVLLVCLCLGVLLCLLGLLVLLLIVHSLFFLRGGREQCCRLLRGGKQSRSGQGGLLPLLPSWPLVQAWAGPVSMTTRKKESHNCNSYASLSNKKDPPPLITAII